MGSCHDESLSRPAHIEPPKSHLRFSVVKGFFQQDEARGCDAGKLGTVYDLPLNLGLKPLNGGHPGWVEFDQKLKQLNSEGAGENAEYVLLYLARHGQSYHNVAEETVGTYIWENPSALSDIPLCHLPQFQDARLTPAGIDQAINLSQTLHTLVQHSHLPLPQSHYISPLHRACTTTYLTWSPIYHSNNTNKPQPNFRPIIHESLREQLYPHICNQRSSLSSIAEAFPSFEFMKPSNGKPQMTEKDIHWSPAHRESDLSVTNRAHNALTDIFRPKFGTGTQDRYISITCHAGLMSGIYRALGYKQGDIPRFPTGIVIPLLLKIERVDGISSNEDDDVEDHLQARGFVDMTDAVHDAEQKKMIGNVDHASHGKDLGGKTLQTILDEIFNPERYELIKKGIKDGKWT